MANVTSLIVIYCCYLYMWLLILPNQQSKFPKYQIYSNVRPKKQKQQQQKISLFWEIKPANVLQFCLKNDLNYYLNIKNSFKLIFLSTD